MRKPISPAFLILLLVSLGWTSSAADLDPAVEACRTRCIERAKSTEKWLKKVDNAQNPAECAEGLSADLKFVRLHAIRGLWIVPKQMRDAYLDAETRNDPAQREKLRQQIQAYASKPDMSATGLARLYVENPRFTVVIDVLKNYPYKAPVAIMHQYGAMKNPKEKAEFGTALLDWAPRRDVELGAGVTIKVPAGEASPFSAITVDPFVPDVQMADDETCAIELVESDWGQFELRADEREITDMQEGFAEFFLRLRLSEPPFDCVSDKRDKFDEIVYALEANRGAIREWLAHNLKYCNFDPGDKRILGGKRIVLDAIARAKGIPSKEYRKNHPWGANEGPIKE